MKRFRVVSVVITFLLLSSARARSGGEAHLQVRPFEGVVIDWTAGLITAHGQAVIGDVRSRGVTRARDEAVVEAREIALARLIRAASGLPVNGRQSISGLIESHEGVAEKFSNAPNLAVEKSRRVAEGFVSVQLELPFHGRRGLLALIARPADTEVPARTSHENPEDRMTGILIDATEAAAGPVLEPRILSDRGRLLFGGQACQVRGAAVYHVSRELANRDRRLGDSPYRVYASSRMQAPGDLFISSEDALRILGSNSGRAALKTCSIVILVKKPAE